MGDLFLHGALVILAGVVPVGLFFGGLMVWEGSTYTAVGSNGWRTYHRWAALTMWLADFAIISVYIGAFAEATR